MVAALDPLNSSLQLRHRLPRRLFQITSSLFVGAITTTVPALAAAPTLSTASFERMASSCAVGVATSTLRAVASVESHFNHLAIRDNTTGQAWAPFTSDIAVSIAKAGLAKGHSLDLGLMQINSANLKALHMSVSNAFDACHSLAAARDILLSAMAAGSSETQRQAAILISLSRYNTGNPLAGITNGYANRVMDAQSAMHSEIPLPQCERNSQWNIWGGHDAALTPPWILTASETYEIGRAGAQTSDARFEGRAPATSSEKGEPYEVSAYRESEASQQ